MYDAILIATDGGEPGRRAAEHGLALAGLFGATVHALAVEDGRRSRPELRSAIDAVAERGDALGLAVTTEVSAGEVAAVVARRAAERGVDLVVAGTRGRRGRTRLFGGSTAESILDRAGAPVLTARTAAGSAPDGYDDVLLAVREGGVGSAADHAAAIAERCRATLHAVCVADARRQLVRRDPGSSCRRAVEDAASRAGPDVRVETRVLTGVPTAELLAYADDTGCELLVQGRDSAGLLTRLTGGDAGALLRRARAPAVTVPE